MKPLAKTALIVGAVILALLIICGIVVWRILSLAATDNIADKYTLTETEDGFMKTVFKGAVFGDEFELSEAMVNTFINEKYCTPFSENGSGIENIRVYFKSGEDTEIYARIYRGGKEYAISAKAAVYSTGGNGAFEIRLHDVRIGELGISDSILGRILPLLIDDTSLYTVTENRIAVYTYYKYDIKNTSIELYLDSFTPQEGYVLCRTNSLTDEALSAAKEYLGSDEFKEDLRNTLDGIKDRLGGIFNE